MKRLSFIVMLLLTWIFCYAQTDSIAFDVFGCFSRVVEVKANAKQAFQYGRAYLSSTILDYQKAVQVEDSETGKIQVNNKFMFYEPTKVISTNDTTFYRGYELYKMTIDCKDNKIRVKVENPTYSYDTYIGRRKTTMSFKNENFFETNGMILDKNHFSRFRSNYYITFINKLVRYIEKQVEEEDF